MRQEASEVRVALLPAYVSIRQHSIRQHTSGCFGGAGRSAACIRPHTSAYVSIAYVSIRQDASELRVALLPAYVSIRQHTSAYVSIRQEASEVRVALLPEEHRASLNRALVEP